MSTIQTLIRRCPSCRADLTPYLRADAKPLDFCLRCKFPLMLVAGKYRLTRVLDEGGFGIVYKAHHVGLRRNADRVVKVLKPEVFAIENMEQRFYREVQITSDLSQRNEHIVRIYDDFGEIPNLGHFYVMEYLEGEPLTHHLQDPQNIPFLEWCFDIFEQLCDAMQAAHEEGIIHRDLKPDNLLLVWRHKHPDFLKILDFGIAKPMRGGARDPQLTQGALGTPDYMSPEQCTKSPLDARSDIYAMGVILYEMLTGYTPFATPDKDPDDLSALDLMQDHVHTPPPSPHILRPDRGITPEIEGVVLKALAKNPEDRFQTVDAFWKALRVAQKTLNFPAPNKGSLSTLDRRLMELDQRLLTIQREETEGEIADLLKDFAPDTPPEPQAVADATNGAAEWQEALSSSDQPSLLQSKEQKEGESPPPPPQKRRWPWLLVLLVLAGALGGGIFYWTRQPHHPTWPPSAQRNQPLRIPPQQTPSLHRQASLTGHQRGEPHSPLRSNPSRQNPTASPRPPTTPPRQPSTASPPSPQKQSPPPTRRLSLRPPPSQRPPSRRNVPRHLRTSPTPSPPRRASSPTPSRRRRVSPRRPLTRLARSKGHARSRKRRKRRRPRKRYRRWRRCPRRWTFIRVRPFLRRKADLSLKGGRLKRRRRGFCLSPRTRKISIEQKDFVPCVFSRPRRRYRTIYLKREGKDVMLSPSYCLQR